MTAAIKGLNGYALILIMILVGLFTLLYEAPRHRRSGEDREVKIISLISFSYLALGIILFVLLLME